VVTISDSARQDVHHHFSIPLQQIDLVYPGVDSTFSIRDPIEIEAFRQRQQLPARYILHVGTLQPRKNIPTLLEAFAKLNQSDTVLVLVGGKGWFYDEIEAKVRSLDLAKRVRFTGYVADADLPLWYNAAAVLVFPSEYEGFGMPIVQAMACGTPVIAANTSAVPEVSGEAARLFDPRDVATLTEQMAIVLDNPKVRAKMRDEGFLQARKFTWKQAGRDMVDVYHKALNET
jgi:glycosyltransferase involved in cell wall biosynthesis